MTRIISLTVTFLVFISSTSGAHYKNYQLSPRRFWFNGLSGLRLPNPFSSAATSQPLTRVARMENNIQTLTNLANTQASLIASLEKQVEEAAPKCQTSDPNAKKIGDVCFSVSDDEKNFNDALEECTNNNGRLAEPSTTILFTSFYDELKKEFPDEIELADGKDIYIGIRETSESSKLFEYIQKGLQIEVSSTSLDALTDPDNTIDVGALVKDTGEEIEAHKDTDELPFVCEYQFN